LESEVTLEDQIAVLTDAAALQLLQRFADAQPRCTAPVTLDAEIADQMRREAELPASAETGDTTEGQVARTALLLVAGEPEHRTGIKAMLENGGLERFAAGETILVVSAVLVALQTRIHFERDKQGRWSFMLDKKPTNSALLRELVKKLLSLG